MKYSDALSKGFATLRSKGLWGFAVTVEMAQFALVAVVVGAAAFVIGPSGIVELLRSLGTGAPPASDTWTRIAILGGSLFVAGILTIPLALIAYSGRIHLADEVQAGRPVTVGQGWAFGLSRLGRTFLMGLAALALVTVLLVCAAIPLVAAVVAAAGSREASGAIIGAVCGGFLLLILLFVALLLASSYLSIAIRYALIGDRTAGEALKAGWQAFHVRFKNVVVWGLIMVGLYTVIYIVQTTLTYAVEFGAKGLRASGGGGATGGALGAGVAIYVVFYIFALVVSIVWQVAEASLWTAFFRQLTGLQPVGLLPGQGYAPMYAPAYPPQPPAQASAPYQTPPQAPAPQPTVYPPTPPAPPVGAGVPEDPSSKQ